jgi:acetyl-CoA carboxylase biotin carboxyl carrier protein
MIELKQLRDLIRLMVRNDLTEIDLQDAEGERVKIRRGSEQPPQVQYIQPPPQAQGLPALGPQPPSPGTAPGSAAKPEAGLIEIKSPMVGTFYAARNPESPPFVEVGSVVAKDTIVGIIEAMKVFSEVQAEVSGTIHKIVVENGKPVDCDTVLFLLKP